jgi:hypothetical protein
MMVVHILEASYIWDSKLYTILIIQREQEASYNIATRYRLDGPRFKSQQDKEI